MKELPEQVDVVVVGSGPSGSTFVRMVRESLPEATIVVVERGAVLTEPPGVNVRNLPANERAAALLRVADPELDARVGAFRARSGEPLIQARPGTRLVALTPANADPQAGMPGALVAESVGGMGSFWTCAVPRPRDSERLPFIADAEFDRALSTAERLLGMSTDAYPSTPVGEEVLRRLSGELDADAGAGARVQRMPLAAQRAQGGDRPRWSGTDVILGELALSTDGSSGLWVLADCAAVRVLMDGDRASGVRVRRAGEEPFDLAARIVVVAADTLRAPQLLWASGIRPPALGRYLNDQPQVIAAVFIDAAESEAAVAPESEAAREPASEESTPETTPLSDPPASASVAFDTGVDHPFHGSPTGGQESLAGVSWIPFDSGRGRPFHGQVMQLDASPIAIGDQNLSDERPIVGIGYFATKDLQPTDRVWFDDADPDEFGLPGIRIDYDLTASDRATIESMVDVTRRTASALGEYVPGGEPIVLPAGSSIHYQGTVRMGERDDGTSVCDARSTVWGTTNLFVGGNGIIPTPIACNPTLTNVALAVRASERIVQLLTS